MVGGETVVLDVEGGRIHQLSPTASIIWRACDGETSVKDIIRLLIQEFDVQQVTAAADVADVTERLRGLKLLSE